MSYTKKSKTWKFPKLTSLIKKKKIHKSLKKYNFLTKKMLKIIFNSTLVKIHLAWGPWVVYGKQGMMA